MAATKTGQGTTGRKCPSRNSSTEDTGQLTGSKLCTLVHKVNTLHFKIQSFLVKEAQELRMVYLVEKPAFMN